MKRRLPKRQTLLVSILLLPGCLALWKAIQPIPTLTESKRIAPLSDVLTYRWIAPGRLYTAGTDSSTIHDLSSGTAQPCKMPADRFYDYSDRLATTFSADGRWAVWCSHNIVNFADLRESKCFYKRLPGGVEFLRGTPLCSPDGKSWITFTSSAYGRSLVRATADQRTLETIKRSGPSELFTNDEKVYPVLLGWIGPNRILATQTEYKGIDDESRQIPFFEISLNGNAAMVRPYLIPIPVGVQFPGLYYAEEYGLASSMNEGVALSPRGDRLAWLIRVCHRPTSLEQFISCRLHSGTLRRYRVSLELRTSRLDGSDMNTIGSIDIPQNSNYLALPRDIQWTPDGRSVSFRDEKWLYQFPVD